MINTICYMRILFFLSLLLLGSCHMGKYYAHQRKGGKIQKNEIPTEKHSLSEITSAEPEIRWKEKNNIDSLVISERKINDVTRIVTYEKTNSNHDSLPKQDTGFVMDDELESAYSAAAFNGVGAIFGFLTFVKANFLYVSLPIYVLALPIFNVIGIICFFISLTQFLNGMADYRNKKYYKIWLLVYGLSVLIALIPLLMFL